ncbi:MAG: hypothetical protein JXL97_12700 [Bacteroidales bacterium]|nr:hypothetical protein [Bacteroidales bacterium]
MLNEIEKKDNILRRFKNYKISAKNIYDFLERMNFIPDDVRDYGEVPHFFRYFEEFDTTVYLMI